MEAVTEQITWLAIAALGGFLIIGLAVSWLLMEVRLLGNELTRTREQLERTQKLNEVSTRRSFEQIHRDRRRLP